MASLDKKITLWNLNKMAYITELDFNQSEMPTGGIHHFLYSYDY